MRHGIHSDKEVLYIIKNLTKNREIKDSKLGKIKRMLNALLSKHLMIPP